jgi:hypothetical protein
MLTVTAPSQLDEQEGFVSEGLKANGAGALIVSV